MPPGSARNNVDALDELSDSGSPRDLEARVDPAALREGVDLAVEDLAERAADDALRLERVRDLAQRAVELAEPRSEVVEAAEGEVAVALEHERVELLLEV